MSKINKKIEALKNNRKDDWQMNDLKSIADHMGIEYKQNGTSHVIFKEPSGKKTVIPAHKPIKPVYIKLFLEMLGDEDV